MQNKQFFQWTAFSPEFLKSAGFDLDFYPFAREMTFGKVEETAMYDYLYLGCSGIKKHKDGKFNLPYSTFLVLRNDGLIAKPYHLPKNQLEPQIPGTILVMNIHKFHHLIRDQRISNTTNSRVWISLCLEFNLIPTRQKIEDKFRQFLIAKMKYVQNVAAGR
ncbi:hypothetical protein [Crocosphaera sp. XPORK-15E]|uniref:hypothetical protein n=1 Tax=Crocosphaera sp. XPORK-15E TaxID=3110247 RepID=UPI002B210CAB|nr:hypothetical protein [Crocosphaera sp. XPORK-15E]MEA5537099.1 hypothetical protein [Crocosphaera sp. XPORK-15E]